MKKIVLLSVLGLLIYGAGCKKKGAASPIPAIESIYFATSPDSMKDSLYIVHAGSFEDTVKIGFDFTDGDADLGNDQNGTNRDIFLKDSRFGDSTFSFFFPEIQNELRNPDYGMSGTVILDLQAAFLFARDSSHMVTGDTVSFEVYIKDQAGHESNRYSTPKILIRP